MLGGNIQTPESDARSVKDSSSVLSVAFKRCSIGLTGQVKADALHLFLSQLRVAVRGPRVAEQRVAEAAKLVSLGYVRPSAGDPRPT